MTMQSLARTARTKFSIKSLLITFSLNLASPEIALAYPEKVQDGNLDDFCPVVMR